MFELFENKLKEKALVISLGEIVTPDHGKAIKELMKIAKEQKKTIDLKKFMETCNPLFADFNLGKITEDDLRKQVSEAAGIEELSEEEFRRIWNSMIPVDEESKKKFETIVSQLLHFLVQAHPLEGGGIEYKKVIIISDTNPIHIDYINEQFGELDKGITLSFSYITQKSKLETLKIISNEYDVTYFATPPNSSEEIRRKLDEENRKKINEIVNSYKEVENIIKGLDLFMRSQQSIITFGI